MRPWMLATGFALVTLSCGGTSAVTIPGADAGPTRDSSVRDRSTPGDAPPSDAPIPVDGATPLDSASDSQSAPDVTPAGCNVPADCPIGRTCDPSTHHCTPNCSGGLLCNGGCCDGTTCQMGTTPTACGSGGTCLDCTASQAGQVCVMGTTGPMCGCNSYLDCPAGMACNPDTLLCSSDCPGGLTCNGGCCDGTMCRPGTEPNQCGNLGSCVDCTTSCSGTACVMGQCGCNTLQDCLFTCTPTSSCDPTTHTCR